MNVLISKDPKAIGIFVAVFVIITVVARYALIAKDEEYAKDYKVNIYAVLIGFVSAILAFFAFNYSVYKYNSTGILK